MELEVERDTMVHAAITMTGPPGLTLEADGHKRLEDILGARERGTSRSKIAAHELMLGELRQEMRTAEHGRKWTRWHFFH